MIARDAPDQTTGNTQTFTCGPDERKLRLCMMVEDVGPLDDEHKLREDEGEVQTANQKRAGNHHELRRTLIGWLFSELMIVSGLISALCLRRCDLGMRARPTLVKVRVCL